MINPENIYFLNTPVEIQDDSYYYIVERLNQFDVLNENHIIYLVFTPINNIRGKGMFKGFIRTEIKNDKDFDGEADFLIFVQ